MNVDYNFYVTRFFGKKITPEDWDRFKLQAEYYVNALTDGRAENSDSVHIQYAVCAAAETIAEYMEKGNIASEHVGNVSVTYDTDKNLRQKILDNAMMYLIHSGLLYRGVRMC